MKRPAILSASGLHVSAFYFALFSAAGAHVTFWPVWARDWGLTDGQIGLYAALMMLARIGGGALGPVIADRRQAPLSLLLVCGLACAAIFALHPLIGTQSVLLIASLAGMGLFSAMLPVGEVLGNAAARAGHYPYAHVRALGPVGFLVASLAVGSLIGWTGPNLVVWWIAVAMLASALLGRTHPGGGLTTVGERPGMADFRALFAQPAFVLFALSTAAIRGSQGVINTYGTLHWQALGLSDGTIGALWAFALVAEIGFLFLVGPQFLRWLGPVGMIVTAGAAATIRWTAMMSDPTGLLLWLLQALHAFSFAACQLGMMKFIEMAVPARLAASAFGIAIGPVGGIAMLIVMAFAAATFPVWAGDTYGIGAGFAAVGTVAAFGLGRVWKRQFRQD